MKQRVLILCLLFFQTTTFAAELVIDNDSTVEKHTFWRMDKEGFVEKFGSDDTTSALINMYFRTRNEGILTFLLSTPMPYVLGGIGVVLDSGTSETVIPIFTATGVVIGTFIGSVMFFSGSIRWISYPRKRLYFILEKHKQGEPLPKSLTKRITKSDFDSHTKK